MKFNSYKLNRWTRLIKVRDRGFCFMCQNRHKIRKMNAHHLYPKRDPRYKKKVYDLNNGITLCWRCHREVIHVTWGNWRRFIPMFRQYLCRKSIKEFNLKRKIK